MHYRNVQYWDGLGDGLVQKDIHVVDGLFADSSNDASRDLSGCFAIPGLIDAHIHLCLNPEIRDPNEQTRPGREQLISEMRQRAEAMLRAGITTARDLGGGEYLELQIRDEIARGEVSGPRLICAGQPITSVGGHALLGR